jgi:Flp pilus assembly pilin Flp
VTRIFLACAEVIRRENGQDLIEYALLASLVALAAMLSVGMFGTILNDAVWVPFVRQVQNV